MPHQEVNQLGVRLIEPDRSDGLASDRRSAFRVVYAGTGQLADVMEEAGKQQDVRPLDPGQVLLYLSDRLDQMPIDGMTVDRIVLWPGADRLPGRNPSADAACEIEGLPYRDDVGARGQQLQQGIACRVRPWCRQRTPQLAEVVSGDGGEEQSALRRERSRLQADKWIAGICCAAQPDFTGVDDQPVISLNVVGLALALDEAQHPMLRQCLARGSYGQVDRMPDHARGETDVAMKIIGVVVAQPGGHSRRLAGDQSVEGTAGCQM